MDIEVDADLPTDIKKGDKITINRTIYNIIGVIPNKTEKDVILLDIHKLLRGG